MQGFSADQTNQHPTPKTRPLPLPPPQQEATLKGSYLWTKEGWFGTKTKTKYFERTLKK